ncbi:hypothetical protein ACJ41O_008767 [Fusarium nematophilum]
MLPSTTIAWDEERSFTAEQRYQNRWNLNIEASLCFQKERRAPLRIFISEHRWKDGEPSEEEAVMILNQGDDSAIPVPAVLIYAALDVILDKAHPGYRVDAGTILYFGPPAGIVLASETTRGLYFVARVALELRGTRTTSIDGQAVPTQCDPYSLYVQLSRCKSLDGIMLLSKARERDFVGNKVPDNMVAAEGRLERLSDATIREAELWDWLG